MTPTTTVSLSATYVEEWNDKFLGLWPHRYDYIQAEHPNPGATPDWTTERRHPLPDRLILQGSYLYGVRFGTTTCYCMLDIDIGSPYHPNRDPLALERIQAAIESLGLVQSLICTSSYSDGLHLYFPFEEAQPSWKIAAAVTVLLENRGFKLAPGQLEIFPNLKPYTSEGTQTLYNAHRLPLQAGSYLLNADLQPLGSSQEEFARQWQFIQRKNDLNAVTLEQLLKQNRRVRHHITTRADKFLNDLNADIELGWTDYGQTNPLIGKIAVRSYVFGHILYAPEPLTGQALADDILNTAKALPGYKDFCRHQDEIEKRATEWARSVETSGRYYPYGGQSLDREASLNKPNRNEQRAEDARDRIRAALANQLDQGTLPSGITARFKVLTSYGISGTTLYGNQDLWHPKHLGKTPSDSPTHEGTAGLDRLEEASSPAPPKNLFPPIGCNVPSDKGLSGSELSNSEEIGCNVLPGKASSDLAPAESAAEANAETEPNAETLIGIKQVRAIIAQIQVTKQAEKQQRAEQKHLDQEAQKEAARQAYTEKMMRFLISGDPILQAEALTWMEQHSNSFARAEVETPSQLALPGVTPQPFDEPLPDPFDLSEILAEISIHRKRLGWSAEQVSQTLQKLFCKTHQSRLDDLELVEWLRWLEAQPSPDVKQQDKKSG